MRFIFSILVLFCYIHGVFSQATDFAFLNVNWTFYNSNNSLKYPAQIPGSIFTDLLENKIIDDPFLGCNSENLRWVEDEEWVYETRFNAVDNLLKNEHIDLIFEGLDTYAEVTLNGKSILFADNMFRKWVIDVKNELKAGENVLSVRFHSATKKGKELASILSYTLPEGERVFLRKAQYHFGWDWGPRLVGCGIWKPVYIRAWNDLNIENVQLIQNSLNKENARLTLKANLNSDISDNIEIEIIDNDSEKKYGKIVFPIEKGTNELSYKFTIDDPIYWWTYDHGKPNLYNLRINLLRNKQLIYSETKKIGLRKIELINRPDSNGESFYFKLNDKPVYIKGANYIPQDVFPSRVTDSTYRDLLEKAKWSNMNMLRVWGGGIYEKDIFYELCDSLGILVWQDFMFACAMYPGDQVFIDNVRSEITEQVIRLRNHPSIALWCGNNEIDEGWHNWGWQKQYNYTSADSIKIYSDYKKLFHELIPEILAKEDYSRPYWPSSPQYGWGRTKSLTHGDSHYWGVWWGMEPFEVYKKKMPRFSSEYGFQGFPDLKTLMEIAPAESLFLGSNVLKCHQKHPRGFETIQEYMSREWPVPNYLEDYIYVSQLVQAYGIRTAIEAHRSAKPYNMGTLYWQYNDCWPVISWSGLDYFHRPKALQYFVRKAFEPVLMIPEITDSSINITIINDTGNPFSYDLWIKIFDIESNQIFGLTDSGVCKVNSRNIVYHSSLDPQLERIFNSGKQFSIDVGMKVGNKLIKKSLISRLPKDFELKKPKISFEIRKNNGKRCICLTTDYYAKNVKLYFDGDESIELSDNYFDMSPKSKVSVVIKTEKSNKWIKKNLRMMSLYDVVEKMK
jgi:beta-mannosidase